MVSFGISQRIMSKCASTFAQQRRTTNQILNARVPVTHHIKNRRMKNIAKVTVLIGLIIAISCEPSGYKYEHGSLPDVPVNLSDFNTEYDDFNSTAPSLGELIPFCFSTNRNSSGKEFDIIYQPMNVNFNKTSGLLKVTNEYANWGIYTEDYEVIKTGLNKIKTTGNELGPNLLIENSSTEFNFMLLYSTDISGNSQINYVSNRTNKNFSEPKEIEFLNSDFEDMYPTFNAEKSRIYFCSNRNEESFDFYYVNINSSLDLEQLLSDNSSYEVLKDASLSSNSDDKCPFIFENQMVFASNRKEDLEDLICIIASLKMENGVSRLTLEKRSTLNSMSIDRF
jgi:hypothetical protein